MAASIFCDIFYDVTLFFSYCGWRSNSLHAKKLHSPTVLYSERNKLQFLKILEYANIHNISSILKNLISKSYRKNPTATWKTDITVGKKQQYYKYSAQNGNQRG